MRANANWLRCFMMLSGAGLLGVSAVLVDFLFEAGYAIPDMTNIQYDLAVPVLWIFALTTLGTVKRFPGGKDLLFMGITGITSAGGMVFYFQSLRLLPVSLSIILLFQFTWMVTLIDAVVKRKWPSKQRWTGSAVICAGTLLAVGLDWPQLQQVSASAATMGLMAAFSFAISLYVPEYMKNEVPVVLRAAITMTFSAVALLFVFPPSYDFSGIADEGLLGWGLLLAVIGQVIPILFMLSAIPKLGGRMAGVLGAVELPATLVSAYFMLGESIALLRWLGAAIIMAGILWSEIRFESWRTVSPRMNLQSENNKKA
ncbi:DMT family transporter [Paenibacillus silvisoli]|uniref:DMT family transporter n=1 Tax=Paenibacillus silvisoli TaxID=3110539 RepID=UPI002804F5E3|nr:DMT family transporter [Paenibacillus silvisoli]